MEKDRYVVREDSSVEIDCNHRLENVTRVTWKYISNLNNTNEIIYDSQSNELLKTGFEISCEPHETFISTCILKLVRAKKEDSGKYICYVGQGNYAKFDSKLLKSITEIELVIRDIKNTTGRSPPMYSKDLHNIKCFADKSENVQCSYYWVHEIGGALIQNPYAILPVENMNSPGNYTCIAKCNLGDHKACIINAMEFEVVYESHWSGSNVALIVLAVIMAVLILIIFPCFIWIKRYLRPKGNDAAGDKHVYYINLELSRDSNIIEHNHNYDSDLLNSDSTSSNSSYDSYSLKKDHCGVIENSSFPFEVKETLEKKTSKYVDIVIYKSWNAFHDRVLMIDGAIWDTSFIGSSMLDTLTSKLLECHPNPNKVLVIGRCEARTVGALLRHSVVESIGVYDIGESVSDQAKELHNWYRNYFKKMARCLDDPRIYHFNGGADYLGNQKHVFNVIITHSSSSCKSPHDYMFSTQYFESVKTALKEGGIALFIVSGQNNMESTGDFVGDELQSLCKQLFPLVEYFQSRFIKNIDHPSGLIRGLICSLNPECDMKQCLNIF